MSLPGEIDRVLEGPYVHHRRPAAEEERGPGVLLVVELERRHCRRDRVGYVARDHEAVRILGEDHLELPELKEPTLLASGVGEVQTGSHWDFVIMDDVCSQENTKTPDAIESLWFWFGETLAQLDPGCRLLVIGTLHHYADIYCRIQKDTKMRALFEFSIHAWCDPISEEPEVDCGEKLFFPGRLTRRFVASQQAFMLSEYVPRNRCPGLTHRLLSQ